MKGRVFKASIVVALLAAAALLFAMLAEAKPAKEKGAGDKSVSGAGTTMLEGGTGSPTYTPVTTKVAFHWRKGAGRFECLALAPSAAAGSPRSGYFDTNVMYVTGTITSATVKGDTAVLQGTSTVTGLGAGSDKAFTATVTDGGPGATLVLEVSGFTFRETLLDGEFNA